MPDEMTEWSARRSGANMTITGKVRGEETKLSNVQSIEIDPEGPFAIFTDGTTQRLAMALEED